MNEWDELYKNNDVSANIILEFHTLIGRHVVEAAKTLELGCGTGNNISLLLRMPTDYYGIDFSQTAIDGARALYPYIAGKLLCRDITKELPFPNDTFDLVCDRASLAHNDSKAIEAGLREVLRVLKPGGIFIASDWFSAKHSERERGEYMADAGRTRNGYPDGQFANIGAVHFFDDAEIIGAFADFEMVMVQERLTRFPPQRGLYMWVSPYYVHKEYISAVWDIVVRKPL